MTLRSKSRKQQWVLRLIGAIVSWCAYVVIFRLVCTGSLCNVGGIMQLRILLPILVLFSIFVYETRWDGVNRDEERDERKRIKDEKGGDRDSSVAPVPMSLPNSQPSLARKSATQSFKPLPTVAGEAEYTKARSLPHMEVPDCELDGEYLGLLARSSSLGYPHASAKLGEYAMRRCAWVEAYYWMKLSQKQGMQNLEGVLCEICMQWELCGNPDEEENVYQIFSYEAGEIGRALLNLDSNCKTEEACAFLRKQHPEWLTN